MFALNLGLMKLICCLLPLASEKATNAYLPSLWHAWFCRTSSSTLQVISFLNSKCTEAILYFHSSLIANSQPPLVFMPSSQTGHTATLHSLQYTGKFWIYTGLLCFVFYSSANNSWCFLYLFGSCWALRSFKETIYCNPQILFLSDNVQHRDHPFKCRAETGFPHVHHLVFINTECHLPFYLCSMYKYIKWHTSKCLRQWGQGPTEKRKKAINLIHYPNLIHWGIMSILCSEWDRS